MTVVLARRTEIDLDSFARAAWQGEDVAVTADALAEVARRREQLLAFVAANPGRKLYGVNVHAGDGSNRLMTEAEQRDYERGLHSGTSFGEPLPVRVIRGIVLARLTNFIEGHAGVSAELVELVAGRLDGRPLPPVPRQGNGGPGEIQALGWLFDDVPAELALGLKEGMALINGSPCASALLADAVLTTSLTIDVAESVFSLPARPPRSPRRRSTSRSTICGAIHGRRRRYAPCALGSVARTRRRASDEHPQPAVSFRILPRVLGNARRVLAGAREAATVALAAVSDNPVFVFGADEGAPAELISNGGFHSGVGAGVDRLA